MSWEMSVVKLGIIALIIMYIVHPPPPPPHLHAHADADADATAPPHPPSLHHHKHHDDRCHATMKASTSVVLATGWAETLYHINLN